MKKLYFLFFLTIGFFGNAQIINFPDANFKAKLLAANSSNTIAQNISGFNFKIDSNNDGEIQLTEASNVSGLNLNNSNITSISGINNFANLRTLDCSYNQLTNMPIGLKSNLRYLKCSNNQISTLNVNGLIVLECNNNLITSLITNSNTNLTHLYCEMNLITSLNLTQNLNLQLLYCGTNQLSNLNLSQNTLLTDLSCSYNQLSSLNLSQNVSLINLQCENNQLSGLNLAQNRSLNQLDCFNNLLTSLDLTNLQNLNWVNCNNNPSLTEINIKNGVLSNSYYGLSFSNCPNLIYVCADDFNLNYFQQKVTNYNYINCNVGTYCSFVPGGNYYNIVGNVKYDYDSDGCNVVINDDFIYPNLSFTISDGTTNGTFITNNTGNYSIPLLAGNYTVTPNLENPTYFNINPTNFTVNFPTQASPFTQNFCVTRPGISYPDDVEIMVLPLTPARPGFDVKYKILLRNKGADAEEGVINFTYNDAIMDYVSSMPIYNNSSSNVYSWNFSSLLPFETKEYEIIFNLNSPAETPPVNINDNLNFVADVSIYYTDVNLTDNIFTLDQTVVGSYDPNDKTCLQGTTITPSEVGKYVHYVIRFENTGTYPAENIVVKDMIDLNKFDITTLVPLKSSHDFYTRINGNKVEFIFENINLDFNDATNDGYVVFKIKTKPTLIVGDTFSNNANIYFDYNFPITTNTYSTTITALSSQDFDFGTYFTLYPNPAKEVLNIQSKQGLTVNSIEIYNQLGQIVMAVTNAVNSVDVANLASGTYFVKVNTEKGSANTKFVKE